MHTVSDLLSLSLSPLCCAHFFFFLSAIPTSHIGHMSINFDDLKAAYGDKEEREYLACTES